MIAAIAIGLCAGIIGGLLGVGGGVLFVPGLVIVLGLGQHQAEATSLLAIVPVAIVGTIKQDGYGNVRRKDALLMGLLSIAGVGGGVASGKCPIGRGAAGRLRAADAARGGSAGAQGDGRAERRRSTRRTALHSGNRPIRPIAPRLG